ncbi:MAG: alpha/beta family hydrolase [Bryobacteraceae bacterium]
MKHIEQELVKGWLHEPEGGWNSALAITHGAGSNCEAPLLKAIAEAFSGIGIAVLRFDMPYRQQRPRGAPFPAQAARDREGLRRATLALRELGADTVFLGGQSYGGRQATMLAAEDPSVAEALLLLSYPLHPPGKPAQARTAHFPNLRTPALFAHGTRDPFGTIDELREAIRAIPARTDLLVVDGARHGLPTNVTPLIVSSFREFLR